jgi:hypothetical protein
MAKHIVGSQGSLQVGPPITLTTPCTLNALRVWLQQMDVLGVGGEEDVTITTTSSKITAA